MDSSQWMSSWLQLKKGQETWDKFSGKIQHSHPKLARDETTETISPNSTQEKQEDYGIPCYLENEWFPILFGNIHKLRILRHCYGWIMRNFCIKKIVYWPPFMLHPILQRCKSSGNPYRATSTLLSFELTFGEQTHGEYWRVTLICPSRDKFWAWGLEAASGFACPLVLTCCQCFPCRFSDSKCFMNFGWAAYIWDILWPWFWVWI